MIPELGVQRSVDELTGMVKRAAGEYLVAFVATLVVFQAVNWVASLLGWALIYLVSCWLFPLRNCGKCQGTKQPRTGDGRGNFRDKPCRRCDSSGERRRWGAIVLGRGAPDRHEGL